MVLGALGREEIDEEAGDVEAVDVGDNPLENGGNVPLVRLGAHAKSNDETDFGNDEEELDPEGDSDDGVLTVMDAQALVFPADEDCTDDVASNKDTQENVVQRVVVFAVEDGEKNKTSRSDDGSNGSTDRVDLLPVGRVWVKFVCVT